MTTIDRLVVIWGDPQHGNRHVVGHLARLNGEFAFWYVDDLANATAHGFSLLPEFPEYRRADRPYRERYLFALFAARIPAPSRRDAKAMLQAWGVERPDDQFEVLAKSGGVRATDRLELLEYRPVDDDLSRPLEFRIASRRHLTDCAPLAISDAVSFRREPTNESDSQAVIVDRNGRRAGYVPRPYAALFARLLDRSTDLRGEVIRQLLVPDDVGKWVVRVTRPTGVESAGQLSMS